MGKGKTLLGIGILAFGLYSTHALASGGRDNIEATGLNRNIILADGTYGQSPKAKASEVIEVNIPVEGEVIKEEEPKKYGGGISAGLNYSTIFVNDTTYEKGMALTFGADMEFMVEYPLWIKPKIDLKSHSLGSDELSETRIEADMALEAKIRLYSSKDINIYIGMGGEYMWGSQSVSFSGHHGNLSRHSGGPQLSLGLDTKYFALDMTGALHSGQTEASYDKDHNIFLQHVIIKATPKVWKIELPLQYEFLSWGMTEQDPVYKDVLHRLSFTPAINATENLAIFLDVEAEFCVTQDYYTGLTAGGGLRVKW
ncbi:MAG: hypothetical protein ABIB71_01300 [Candidatus Woesearchaeota archaeon]